MESNDVILISTAWVFAAVLFLTDSSNRKYQLAPTPPMRRRDFLWSVWWACIGYNIFPRIPLYLAPQDTSPWWLTPLPVALATALPFGILAVYFTVRRLRTVHLPAWLAVFALIPFVNLVVWMVAALVSQPSSSQSGQSEATQPAQISATQSVLRSVAIAVAVGFGFCIVATQLFGRYGVALYLGAPFLVGTLVVLLYGNSASRSFWRCQLVMTTSMLLIGIFLVACAIEGVFCVVMSLPIALFMGFLGATLGYFIQPAGRPNFNARGMVFCMPLFVPAVVAIDTITLPRPPMCHVSSSVLIQAPPEKVWSVITGDCEIAPSPVLSLMGINEPLQWSWQGHGPGAVRRCEYQIGGLIEEPIEQWEPLRSFRFSVKRCPPAMRETSPYNNLQPLHVENHYIVHTGEFRLTPVGCGTLLTANTSYTHDIWPIEYWTLWSNSIMRQVHLATLNQVKESSENAVVESGQKDESNGE